MFMKNDVNVPRHIEDIKPIADWKQFLKVCSVVCLLLVAVCIFGCGKNMSYVPRTQPIPTESMALTSQTEKDIEVAIDPYIEIEKQRTVFDEDMANEGVIPVRVLVANCGSKVVAIRQSDVQLVLEDGSVIIPITPRDASIRFVNWNASGAVSSIPGLVGMIAGPKVMKHQLEISKVRTADFKKKGLHDVKLEPQNSTQGFVFFDIKEKKVDFTKAVCTVRIIDIEEATSNTFRFQLVNAVK